MRFFKLEFREFFLGNNRFGARWTIDYDYCGTGGAATVNANVKVSGNEFWKKKKKKYEENNILSSTALYYYTVRDVDVYRFFIRLQLFVLC